MKHRGRFPQTGPVTLVFSQTSYKKGIRYASVQHVMLNIVFSDNGPFLAEIIRNEDVYKYTE